MELLLYNIIMHDVGNRCPRLTRLISPGIAAARPGTHSSSFHGSCTVHGRTAPTTTEQNATTWSRLGDISLSPAAAAPPAATARGGDLAVVAHHDRRERTARLHTCAAGVACRRLRFGCYFCLYKSWRVELVDWAGRRVALDERGGWAWAAWLSRPTV